MRTTVPPRMAGSNLKRAVKAYQQMSSQPTDGVLSAALCANAIPPIAVSSATNFITSLLFPA